MLNLFVGAIGGGPETDETKIHEHWTSISHLKDSYCDESLLGVEGFIDFVFHIPGSVMKPDFKGIRTGRFSRKQKILQIQCAVPKKLVDADEEKVVKFIFKSIREAIDIAKLVFKKAKIKYNADEQYEIIDKVEKQYHEMKLH